MSQANFHAWQREKKPAKLRLDECVLSLGWAEDIQKARSLILSGSILLNDRIENRIGVFVSPNAKIRKKEKIKTYVSRGAYKLLGAFELFPGVSVSGRLALDLGSSTGGFTQVLLEQGASCVIAVDVGYGQMAERLRRDPRVVVLDRFHIRDLTWTVLDPYLGAKSGSSQMDLFVVSDLSFVSVRLVFEILAGLHRDRPSSKWEGITLIKPQFETRSPHLLEKGVLKDSRERFRVLCSALRSFRVLTGGKILGLEESPIRGRNGNREYLFYYRIAE